MSIRALNTGLTGLTASRVGIDTASNNIANANTKGYTRQRIDLSPELPTSLTFGEIGNGVKLLDISRTRDAFLDERVRDAVASLNALDTRTDLLSRTEATLGEPEFGISAQLDSLFEAFEELALDPTSRGSQVEVVHRLEALTGRIRQITNEVDAIASSTRTDITSKLTEANGLVAQVAELNQAVDRARVDGTPNQLLDRRDLAVDQLVELTGATARLEADGMYSVKLNGLSVVQGTTPKTLSFDPSTDQITHDQSGVVVTLGGVVGGQQQFLIEDVPSVRAGLSSLATDLADTLNAQHASGFSGPGAPGGPLLSYNPTDAAATVAAVISDPADLASSDTDAVPYPIHNGENAMRLAELRTSLSAAGGTQSLTGLTRQLVADVGSRVSAARDSGAAQLDLATAARLSREAEHGVSLDEEMVELMRYQRAYAAAARVITTADSALDVLINRTGIVGR